MSEKPLVALLTNNDDDVFCFRLELVQAILREGYKLLISCPDGPKFEALEIQYGLRKGRDFYYDDPPIDRRGTSVRKDARLMAHYLRVFREYEPAVLLTYTAKPNVYGSIVAHALKIPVINNVTGFGSILQEHGPKRAFIMWLFRLAYRHSACVMFQNETNLRLAQSSGMVHGKTRLIPGSGVNTERFPVQDYPDGGDGKNGAPVIFNYIGRIMHDKGVDDYIEAARQIRARYPQTEFNMLGFIEPTENHYCAELKELGKQGIVCYRGSQIDVRPWIERSHCIIHPSTYGEGMSNVLLENASCGRPIITTDNPGCKETLDDRISGFIYRGNDVHQLVNVIEFFLTNLQNSDRRQMGLQGRSKIEKEFSREVVVDAYLNEIETLL